MRLVGFLSNNSPAYIQFKKNADGNYRWEHSRVASGTSFHSFNPSIYGYETLFMFVMNAENEVAKMQVDVNRETVTVEFEMNTPNVS